MWRAEEPAVRKKHCLLCQHLFHANVVAKIFYQNSKNFGTYVTDADTVYVPVVSLDIGENIVQVDLNVVNVRSELFVKKISDVWQRTAIFVRNGLVDDK